MKFTHLQSQTNLSKQSLKKIGQKVFKIESIETIFNMNKGPELCTYFMKFKKKNESILPNIKYQLLIV